MAVARGIQLETEAPKVKIKRSRKPSKVYTVTVYDTGTKKYPESRDKIFVGASTKGEAASLARQKMIEYYGKAKSIQSIEETTPEFMAKHPLIFRKGPRWFPRKNPEARLRGKFFIQTDRMGDIIITRPHETGKSVFLQFESDKELVHEILKKTEREELDKGWEVEIEDSEPRASTLQELWDNTGKSNPGEAWHRKRADFLKDVVETYPALTLSTRSRLTDKEFENREAEAESRKQGIPNPSKKSKLLLWLVGGGLAYWLWKKYRS